MRKLFAGKPRISLRLAIVAVLVLTVGALATAYLVRQRAVRPYDPQAVPQAPATTSPGSALVRPPDGPVGPTVELSTHPKLTTPLADLARAVPQVRGALAAGQQLTAPAGFTVDALPKSAQDAVRAGQMQIDRQARVQTYVVLTEWTDANLTQLSATGVSIELTDESQRIAQVRIPLARLEEVAALPFVERVRLPDYGIPNIGAITSEGDAILAAVDARNLLGVDGSGVSIGVVSDGIAGIFDSSGCGVCSGDPLGPLASGDLPVTDAQGNPTEGLRDPLFGILTSATGGLIAQSFRSDLNLEGGLGGAAVGAEGTAMLEIIHDLAPGAQLYFANFQTSVEFSQAVVSLQQKVDIVVDDISFFSMAYDGSSPVSAKTSAEFNNNANPVRAHFTSVGNRARNHYQEPWVDSGTDGSTIGTVPTLPPGNLHQFQPGGQNGTGDCLGQGTAFFTTIFLNASAGEQTPGSEVIISLVWDDPWGASFNDYNLYLMDTSNAAIVASSTNVQNGVGDPVETINYTNNTGASNHFFIFIQNVANAAAPVEFDMFVLGATAIGGTCTNNENVNHFTVASSVPAQSDAGGTPNTVLAVGAIDQADIGNDDIQTYSSNGPTNDGRFKPDFAAIDGVLITGAAGFGSGTFPNARFFGTSAAAPHMAGLAALVMQSSPCLIAGSPAPPALEARALVLDYLSLSATDLGAPGSDNVYGYGRPDALVAVNHTLPTANAGTDVTVSGTDPSGESVSLDASLSSDPSGCPLTYTWSGDCGSGTGVNPTLTCPLGVNNVDLAVSNGGASVTPVDSVQVTVTNFSAGASPASATVSAGQTANYTVTLTPVDGPFDNAITLSCTGTPSLSGCSFSTPTVTPGGSAATAQLIVTTTAPSMAPPAWPTGWPLPPVYVVGLVFALTAMSVLLLGRSAPRARKPAWWLPAAAVLCMLVFLVACGGSKKPKNPGTPPGTYTISVTGTAGTLTHSTTVNMVVQ